MRMFFRNKPVGGLDYIQKKSTPAHLTTIMEAYSQIDAQALREIRVRGQRAWPMSQIDVDNAKATVSLLINQSLGEKRARMKSVGREIDDLLRQLSETLDFSSSMSGKSDRHPDQLQNAIGKQSPAEKGCTNGNDV